MALRPITFTDASVYAADHGALFNAFLTDGIVSGLDISMTGKTITVGAGFVNVKGRLIEHNTSDTFTESSTGVLRVKLILNVSTGVVSFGTDTATTEEKLSALTQEDINNGGTTYEVALAVGNLSSGTIIRKIGRCAWPVRVVEAVPAATAADGVYIVV